MTLHEAYQKVLSRYDHDVEQTMAWFNTPIFEFKHKSANELIKKKQKQKVIEYIDKHFK